MALSLIVKKFIITACKCLLRFVFDCLLHGFSKFITTNGVRNLASPQLFADKTMIITELESSVTQFREDITLKLKRLNIALDKAVPLKLHRKLLPIIRFTEFFISKSKSNKISSELVSNGLQEFQVEEYMKSKSEKVNKALDELVRAKRSPATICDSMAYSLLGDGKRVRPILCIASCELVGGDESWAMPMACALEIIHTASLIVDDLPRMDNYDRRRWKPSNHKRYGEHVAILAGTALSCLAFEHIVSKTEKVFQDRMVEAIKELASAVGLNGLVAGQFWDMDSRGKELTLEQLEKIYVHKTGSLLEASVICGAIIGGASAIDVERLRKYATCIGLLFQVVDDILDETLPEEKLGKTAGKDLASDKATFPKLIGIDGANRYAVKLVGQAVEELSHFDDAQAAPLKHLAYYILNRQLEMI